MSADARRGRIARALLVLIVAGLVLGLPLSAQDDDGGLDRAIDQVEGQPMPLEASPNRLSDQVLPLRLDLNQDRPGPLLELGDPFLGVGPIGPGFELGTGAVWNPGFQVFGSFRSAIQVNDDGRDPRVEWANRLDLFGNLAFTPTERILIGLRPIDDEGRDFVGYYFSPDEDDGWHGDLDGRLTTLFFEGDFGEIFPDLDPDDSGILDFGFAVGRQLLSIQDGMLINDRVDGFGLTRNTLKPWGLSNLRLTFFYAWNELDRGSARRDNGADLFGLFSEADWGDSTVALDLAWVASDDDSGDAFFFGVSAVQRIAALNTSFRFLGSVPADGDSAYTREGYLLFVELSWTPSASEDLWYLNAYWGIDEFSSALRSPDAGGPLARTGILYTAQGLGRYRSALDSDPARSVGIALGRQFFFAETRRQLIVELGGRVDTDGRDAAAALGLRFQQAFDQHFILQVDAHGALREGREPAWGLRVEWLVKF